MYYLNRSILSLCFLISSICLVHAAPKESSTFSASDCEKDVSDGPAMCLAAFQVYTWNQQQQQCQEDIYGGCFATNNNFDSLEECQKVAEPVCKKQP